MAKRLQAMGVERYHNAFEVTIHEDLVELPLRWKQPRLIFVNSMSDLFHEKVPIDFIKRIFDVMERCPQHSFQILTKRSNRLLEVAHLLPWPSNIWMGVSVEDERVIFRIYDLQKIPASIRFLSCEPLIGPLDKLPLQAIHWVIVGGESGPEARPIHPDWVISILNQCQAANIPFFFKQWGGTRKDLTGRRLNGRTYDEMPVTSMKMPDQLELPLVNSLYA
jgi:protein gp37